MNDLELFIVREGIPDTEAMNRLQASAVISDNCVTAGDVTESDCRRAVEFLEGK